LKAALLADLLVVLMADVMEFLMVGKKVGD
jgi:hypothetical protein